MFILCQYELNIYDAVSEWLEAVLCLLRHWFAYFEPRSVWNVLLYHSRSKCWTCQHWVAYCTKPAVLTPWLLAVNQKSIGRCVSSAGHVTSWEVGQLVGTEQCFPKMSRVAEILILECCLGKILMLFSYFFCFILLSQAFVVHILARWWQISLFTYVCKLYIALGNKII